MDQITNCSKEVQEIQFDIFDITSQNLRIKRTSALLLWIQFLVQLMLCFVF